MKKIIFLLVLTSVIVSCKKKNSDDPSSVTPKWFATRQNASDIATVSNGVAYLKTSNNGSQSPNGLSLSSFNKLKGDFVIKLSFSSFSTSGANSLSEWFTVGLSDQESVHPLVASILTNTEMYLEDNNVDYQVKSTTNREGEFYAKRVGADFFTWCRVGSDTLRMDKLNYSTKDVSIFMNITGMDNTATNTSIQIKDVLISGGGGLLTTDTFDNNTISVIR